VRAPCATPAATSRPSWSVPKRCSPKGARNGRPTWRKGLPGKAIGAVAASILTAAYHILQHGTLYEDLGPGHFDKRAQAKQVHRLIDRLRNLGFAVQITPMEAAA